jgi:L,D-peptidoglycan transpeptidase YkuD (ErfK/YbiS/YcfS/YnhG family)
MILCPWWLLQGNQPMSDVHSRGTRSVVGDVGHSYGAPSDDVGIPMGRLEMTRCGHSYGAPSDDVGIPMGRLAMTRCGHSYWAPTSRFFSKMEIDLPFHY